MSKRILRLFLLLGAAAYLFGTAANAGETVAVIINKENPAQGLSLADIRKIYTNNILNWPDGAPITLYDLLVQDPRRGTFSEKVLGRTPELVAEEWAHLKITNQAKNPPLTMKSEALIIRRVSKEKGAIGYVSLSSVRNNPEVKVIQMLQ